MQTNAISPPRPLADRESGGEGSSADLQFAGSVICLFFESLAGLQLDSSCRLICR